jgi:methylthioribulose-1-phosphate dehydratase
MSQELQQQNNDHLVQSDDPEHPANLIPELCRKFYNWGWVTGTGGGVSACGISNAPRFLFQYT